MNKTRLTTLLLLSVLCFTVSAQSIFRTACGGNQPRLDSLLAETPMDTVDDRSRSLLHWAVACNRSGIVDFLLARDMPADPVDDEMVTPLQMSVRYNRISLFNKLSNLPEYENWKTQYGAVLLETAILRKNEDFAQKLIEEGVDIHIRNDRGSTPLEIAQRIGADNIATWFLAQGADQKLVRSFDMKGPYLGQKPPGMTPTVFAPNIISTEESEFGSVFNKDATEFFYAVDANGKNEIRYSRLENNEWSQPEIILSHEQYSYNDPFLSPDEQRLYFISRRPVTGKERMAFHDIWYVEKTNDGWSEPVNAGPNINSDATEFYISFTKEGTMYFASSRLAPEDQRRSALDIYYSEFVNGEFQKPVRLGNSVNTHAYEADVFVSPDESYIIFCGIRKEGLGRGDLYISFRNEDGSWARAVNMGDKINTKGYEYCPYVTSDGKYFFYTSQQDIYWVDARILEEFRR